MTYSKEWEIPKNLSPEAQKAAEFIRDFCHEKGYNDTGGERVFYSPQEWRELGHSVNDKVLLIVIHEGGMQQYIVRETPDLYEIHYEFRKTLGDVTETILQEFNRTHSMLYEI